MEGTPEARELPGPRTAGDASGEPGATFRCFLIADVRGYTDFTARQGDEAAGRLAARFAAITREVAAGQHGQLLELRGDEALVVFTSARQAVRAALVLQDRFVGETLADPTLALPVGIGLDAGEAVAVEGGYRGGALNLAARLCGEAGPGEVLASQEVTHLARRVDGIRYLPRGRVTMKGLTEPVPVIQVLPDTVDAARETAFRAALAQPGRRRRPRGAVVVAGALVLAVLVAAGVYAVNRATKTTAALSVQDRVDVVDISTGRVVDQVRLGANPSSIAYGAGSLWATNAGDGTVSRLDPTSHLVRATIDVGGHPAGVVVSDGVVWVTDQDGQTVVQISPKVDRVVDRVRVGNRATGIAAGPSGVWVTNTADGTVSQIDPRTGRVGATVDVGAAPTGVAVTRDTVWVTNNGDGTLSAIDAHSYALRGSTPVGNGPAGIVAAAGSLWVANTLDGTLARVDPATGAVTTKIPVGNGPTGVAGAGGAVWVTNEFGATIVRVDPGRNLAERTAKVGGAPGGLAAAGGTLWVTATATGTSHRGGTLTVAARAPLDTIDPAKVFAGDFAVAGMVYDHLVAYRRAAGAAGTTLVPDLATAIPAPVDGGRTYAFRLRKGIRYSTGGPVRASDLRRGIERTFLLPNTYGQANYAGVVGADACLPKLATCDLSRGIDTDDATGSVTFHLVAPDPEFLAKLALPIAAAVPPGTPTRDVGAGAVPATGPYMVGRYVPGVSLELVRNPHFKEWSRAARPDGYPDRIVLNQVESSRALPQVLRGEVDFALAYGSFGGRTQELRTRYPGQLHQDVGLFVQYLAFNTKLAPFDDVRARRALSFAVDRARMERLWRGFGGSVESSCQLLPPGFPGYAPYCPYTLDLARARRLVAASGTAGDPVTLVSTESNKSLGRYLVGALEDIGYAARVTVVPDTAMFDDTLDRLARTASLLPFGWGTDYPSSSGYLVPILGCRKAHPDVSVNFGSFCHPTTETAIQQALAVQPTQPAAAARLWQQVDHAAADLAAVLPIGILVEDAVTSKRVGNYQHQPVYGVLLDQLWVKP